MAVANRFLSEINCRRPPTDYLSRRLDVTSRVQDFGDRGSLTPLHRPPKVIGVTGTHHHVAERTDSSSKLCIVHSGCLLHIACRAVVTIAGTKPARDP